MEPIKDLKIEDFIQNWNIDLKNKSATHKSGLKINYLMDNGDGSIRLEFDNLIEWEKEQLKSAQNREAIQNTEKKLIKQFYVIYKEKMQQPASHNLNRLHNKNFER